MSGPPWWVCQPSLLAFVLYNRWLVASAVVAFMLGCRVGATTEREWGR